MTCKNCGSSFEGKFCYNCGQKAEIHRITLKHFFHELFHAFTHTDKGILLLAKDLIKRPGHIAREYLDGKRKKYFNPLSFLVITTAVYAFASYQTGYFKAISSTYERPPRTTQQAAVPRQKPPKALMVFYRVMGESSQISINNGKLLGLFLIFPLIAFFTWLFFKKSKTNFAESLVLNAFIMGEMYIVMSLIFVPAFVIAPQTVQLNNNIFHGAFLIYMVVAYRQFFGNNIFLTILKSVLIMFLYIFFFWLLIMLYVFVKYLIFN